MSQFGGQALDGLNDFLFAETAFMLFAPIEKPPASWGGLGFGKLSI
jgi:hypothetical protein